MKEPFYTVRNAQHLAEFYGRLTKVMAERGDHRKARRYANIAEQHKRLVAKLTGG